MAVQREEGERPDATLPGLGHSGAWWEEPGSGAATFVLSSQFDEVLIAEVGGAFGGKD